MFAYVRRNQNVKDLKELIEFLSRREDNRMDTAKRGGVWASVEGAGRGGSHVHVVGFGCSAVPDGGVGCGVARVLPGLGGPSKPIRSRSLGPTISPPSPFTFCRQTICAPNQLSNAEPDTRWQWRRRFRARRAPTSAGSPESLRTVSWEGWLGVEVCISGMGSGV